MSIIGNKKTIYQLIFLDTVVGAETAAEKLALIPPPIDEKPKNRSELLRLVGAR